MKKSKLPKQYSSYDELIAWVSTNMPDEYPSGMAILFADDMLKNGEAVIKK